MSESYQDFLKKSIKKYIAKQEKRKLRLRKAMARWSAMLKKKNEEVKP